MKNINTIRMLSIDMIEEAQSGHPGICMGAAPIMYALYSSRMKVYAQKSNWINRDRFVLSAGHGSAMLYATLHLAGYDISIDDLKNFRKLNSKTPGHPEYKHTDGVDSTSGPLGQGLGQAVGMAIAEKHLSGLYNKEELNIIDHYTYVICGDGDLQEGISHEVSSLAGHLKLDKLIVLWDSNNIQLDSKTSDATSEDTVKRYRSYGWNVLIVDDGNDINKIELAIEMAHNSPYPTLIEVKTEIGFGSPLHVGKTSAHGAPLGKIETQKVRENYGMSNNPFDVKKEVYEKIQKNTLKKGKKEYKIWEEKVQEYKKVYPEKYSEILGIYENEDLTLNEINSKNVKEEATRVTNGKIINNISKQIPNFIGGSADLSKSNNTLINNSGKFNIDDDSQKNIFYGVREFGMGAITNGIVLHGGLKAFCSTFFVFSDYLKPAIRMSALQKIPSIFVFTHDSIAVGEDGPTHQPIEQLSGLRAIPNFNVIRPCDAFETQKSWEMAINSKGTPTAIILTRQNLKVVTSKILTSEKFATGGYVIDDEENFETILIASGSEVQVALDTKRLLKEKNMKVRVISMPSLDLFKKQNKDYQDKIFGKIKRQNIYYIEMGTAAEAYQYAGNLINIENFGKSGCQEDIIKDFDFDSQKIADKILKISNKNK